MKHSSLLIAILLVHARICLAADNPKPNVILVMCDDLGYGDPQFFNPRSPIDTPNIDAMAAAGMKFNRFYSAAPVCSPTRGSCITGRHPFRYGIYSANTGHMKKQEITLPELLKNEGYTTGHFGKWHLGTLTTTINDANRGGPRGKKDYSVPSQHGYDDSFVTESKVPTFDPMIKPENAGRSAWDAIGDKSKAVTYGTHYWDHAGRAVTENLEGDDSRIIMDRAVPFIESAVAENTPFFVAIWFHAPHLPVVAGKEHVAPYKAHGVYERNYYGCVSTLDEQVGRLRSTLHTLGISEKTLLCFCSDNGPEGQPGNAPGSTGGFRGRKRSLYEGGVRVPGIIEWPGTIAAGSSTNFPAVTSDYLPTVLDLLGVAYPGDRPLDGVSLADVIRGTNIRRSQPIGFQSKGQIAWHAATHKLYSGDSGKTWELYDLTADPGESNNLAAAEPVLTAQLRSAAIAWQQSCKRSDAGADY